MAPPWTAWLRRWREAGLIDPATAAAIAAWEERQPARPQLTTPVRIATGLGAVLLAAGLLLFVSAHWQALAPWQRFALLLVMVVGLHGSGAALATRFSSLSVALHGVGTVTLGAGIFLAGQIFHLDAHWPAGLLLWTVGAAIGWLLLRQWPQLVLLAVLGPAWLESEWFLAAERLAQAGADPPGPTAPVAAAGLLLLSLSYFSASDPRAGPATSDGGGGAYPMARRVLLWVGGLALLPAMALWTIATMEPGGLRFTPAGPLAGAVPPAPAPLLWLEVLGWTVAIGMPLLLSLRLRRRRVWPLGVAVAWMLVGLAVQGPEVSAFTHGWNALGGLLLIGWGVAEARSERINMGAAVVGLTLLTFYFSEVMDKLGRSASLVGLGVLFLAGGWALETLRRRLVRRTRLNAPRGEGEG